MIHGIVVIFIMLTNGYLEYISSITNKYSPGGNGPKIHEKSYQTCSGKIDILIGSGFGIREFAWHPRHFSICDSISVFMVTQYTF